MQLLKEAIEEAFEKLNEKDGSLFEIPIDADADYEARKLHEVCVNHKLANYLEKYLFEKLDLNEETFFVDIEFNREGTNYKELEYNNEKGRVRPDIIVHNRKSGDEKINILVVECKKSPAKIKDIQDDREKINAFLTNQKYQYDYGLQAIYSKDGVSGKFFYKENDQLLSIKI